MQTTDDAQSDDVLDQPPKRQKVQSRMILEAIMDLYDSQRTVTKTTICEFTGYRMAIVDEHVDKLLEAGKIKRVSNGIYEPAEFFPAPRALSATVLPNGLTKLEAGDEMIELTPHECRLAALLLGGHYQSYHNQALMQSFNLVASQNDTLLREMRRTQSRLERRVEELLCPQGTLPLVDG